MSETIAQIKTALQSAQADDARLTEWRQDTRKGVVAALAAFDKRLQAKADQKAAFLARFSEEDRLWQAGYSAIAGVDEVGRGPLAGPVVAAAVILPPTFDQYGVIDSKQVSLKHRLEYVETIKDEAIAYGVGVIDAQTIDQVNIYQASRLAMKAAIENLDQPADYLLIDAMTVDLDIPQESLIKG
ncbi:ribonuclease HII, partial [Fructobacillus ficulneus]